MEIAFIGLGNSGDWDGRSIRPNLCLIDNLSVYTGRAHRAGPVVMLVQAPGYRLDISPV